MPIFLLLVAIALGCQIYTFSLGWRYHYGHARSLENAEAGRADEPGEAESLGRLIPAHFVWGMVTGVIVCFLHSIVLVYFLGTGKAIKEQMELQNWDSTDHDHAKRVMSRAVFPTASGIVLVLITAISGGFTLIQALHPDLHMVIAVVAIGGQIPIFARQLSLIRENGQLMDRVIERLGGEDIRIAL